MISVKQCRNCHSREEDKSISLQSFPTVILRSYLGKQSHARQDSCSSCTGGLAPELLSISSSQSSCLSLICLFLFSLLFSLGPHKIQQLGVPQLKAWGRKIVSLWFQPAEWWFPHAELFEKLCCLSYITQPCALPSTTSNYLYLLHSISSIFPKSSSSTGNRRACGDFGRGCHRQTMGSGWEHQGSKPISLLPAPFRTWAQA